MRRCKKHNTDLSSIIGVCASCLRESLFKLILAQEQAQAQAQPLADFEIKPEIPISASPYITRRKSDTSVASVLPLKRPYNKPRLNHSLSDQRFFNSPQIVINTGGCIGSSSSNPKKNRSSLIRFSSFSNLFRFKSRNGNEDANLNSNETSGVERKLCVRDRGMSPVRLSTDGREDELSSEYESCKQTPQKTPNRRGGSSGNRSVSELIFCLSPLVRESPNRLSNLKGKPPAPADGDVSRTPVVPHLAYTKLFFANRSRKLADFGRPDLNR